MPKSMTFSYSNVRHRNAPNCSVASRNGLVISSKRMDSSNCPPIRHSVHYWMTSYVHERNSKFQFQLLIVFRILSDAPSLSQGDEWNRNGRYERFVDANGSNNFDANEWNYVGANEFGDQHNNMLIAWRECIWIWRHFNDHDNEHGNDFGCRLYECGHGFGTDTTCQHNGFRCGNCGVDGYRRHKTAHQTGTVAVQSDFCHFSYRHFKCCSQLMWIELVIESNRISIHFHCIVCCVCTWKMWG